MSLRRRLYRAASGTGARTKRVRRTRAGAASQPSHVLAGEVWVAQALTREHVVVARPSGLFNADEFQRGPLLDLSTDEGRGRERQAHELIVRPHEPEPVVGVTANQGLLLFTG